MKRLLTRLAFTLWLVPLMAIVALWARSYLRLDEFSRVTNDYRTQAVVSYQGGLHIIQSGKTAAPRPLTWDVLDIPEGATRRHLYTFGAPQWQLMGFARIGSAPRTSGAAANPAPARIPPAAALAPWLTLSPLDVWIVPYWALSLPFCLPGIRRASLNVRGLIRRRHRRCVACGYDLRASPTQCPECGSAAAI